ncbi:hypothetical protein PQX77_005607 [Marasmius sp. AFHP31]|nr:hypothetical protein PQX77_005607 [Marasmius sp. AFHP31]
MLDVLWAVPKLTVQLRAACVSQTKSQDFQKRAAGYSHTYFAADNANFHFLSTYLTDEELASATAAAYEEAVILWGILGYFPKDGETPTVLKDELVPEEEDDDELPPSDY